MPEGGLCSREVGFSELIRPSRIPGTTSVQEHLLPCEASRALRFWPDVNDLDTLPFPWSILWKPGQAQPASLATNPATRWTQCLPAGRQARLRKRAHGLRTVLWKAGSEAGLYPATASSRPGRPRAGLAASQLSAAEPVLRRDHAPAPPCCAETGKFCRLTPSSPSGSMGTE